MRRVRVGDSSGKVRLLRPVATSSHPVFEDPPEAAASGWRGHLLEIAFVAAVWLLAIVQVVIVVARGGTWTPDSTLALAFALACPLALRGFRSNEDAAE